ncbi:outer membrane protein [Candidatus Pantoea varia]|uniref:Outer membrane protein n=1 Tax=Candidatus Pantoea varia TaxID=1881036 RepID=A0A1I5HUK1_9GAMM|nr:TolC family outer membrane protein [Pantoea varia]SFO51975.1 outer membrane protein [Pantoea varia]
MLIKFIAPLAGGILLSSHVWALSLQESLIAANIYNAEINAARSVHDADGQKKYQGFAGLLPVITLDGSWSKTDQPDATYSAGVTRHNYSFNLTQPVFDMAKYATWRRSVVIGNLADVNLLIAQQKLISDVTTAFYGVLYQRSVLETNQRILAAFNAKLKQSQKALEVGDGTRLDEVEAQANYDKAVADELAAENDLNDANVSFRQLTGMDAQSISDKSMRCVSFNDRILPEQLKRDAAANNLDVLAAIQNRKASEADILSSTSNHMPVVTFQAGYGKNWSRAEDGNYLDTIFGTTSKTDNTQISVNVSVPLFAGGSQISQSLEAAHRYEQNKDLVIDSRRKAEQQAIQAASGVQNSQSRIKAYERAISSANKRLAATRYGRKIGQRTLIDEFNAEKEYFQAIQDLAQAKNTLIQSIVKLKTATGKLDYAAMKSFNCGSALPEM